MTGEPTVPVHRPLTDLQQSMLAHEALQGVPLYNVPRLFRLSGPVDVDALQEAFRHVVRRHPVLRCTFDADHAVEAGDVVPLPELDLRGGLARHDAVSALAPVWETPFRPAEEVPVRAVLATVSPDEHHLALCLHHVVADSWSLSLLLRDLAAAYVRLLHGGKPDDTAAPDFFALAAAERARTWDTAWWRERLAGAPPQPRPREEPPPHDQQGTHTRMDLRLDAAATRGLRSLARLARVSPAVVLFTAVSTAVATAEAPHESTLGLPAVLRDTLERQETVGPLLNTLPVRTSWTGAHSGTALVQEHHASVEAALAHKGVPYSRIIKASGARRRPTPLYLHVVNVDNEAPRLRLPRVRVTPTPILPRWAVFPAHWVFSWGTVGNITGVLHAGLDAFTHDQATTYGERFRSSLRRLLRGV